MSVLAYKQTKNRRFEVYCLLRYETTSIGKYIPTFRSSLLSPYLGPEQSKKRLFTPWRWRYTAFLIIRYVFSNRNDVIQENLRLYQPPLWQPQMSQISGSRSEIRKVLAVFLWSLQQSALSRAYCSTFWFRGLIGQAYRWGCPSHSKKTDFVPLPKLKETLRRIFPGELMGCQLFVTLFRNSPLECRQRLEKFSQYDLQRWHWKKKNYIFRRVREIAKSGYKLRHVYLSFFPSVLPIGRTRLSLDGCSWNLIFERFSKICRQNPNFIKIWQE